MNISQPRWKTPEYSKREINEAGAAIRNSEISPEDRAAALRIVDNWRSAHAYPLHVFYMNLRGKCGSRKDILVAERLKRMDSIVGKLQREEGMQGCPIAPGTVSDEKELISEIEILNDQHHILDMLKAKRIDRWKLVRMLRQRAHLNKSAKSQRRN